MVSGPIDFEFHTNPATCRCHVGEDKDRLLHGLAQPSLMASSDQGNSDPGVATSGK